ncbi:histone-lysine N-methyltransferase eggless-like [Contarinia nasturtii]|uniref:histone-lysine N-methyltransferase eggless-like n=1 Tax=Contarinia nasturtii TaxID=265458 RepID=UPI0012D3B51D|nr:histone-lysine N-methyltransferase eggless-like [Contarinia nasturtii]XP_031640860.1 histone-lysine N-methyltransferase eggless-like [Contarinia nasturtii]
MEFDSDESRKPSEISCSKSLGISRSNDHRNKKANIGAPVSSEESNDSAYYTGGAVSPSPPLASPNLDTKDTKVADTDSANRRPKMQFYANITCDPQYIGPWQPVTYIKKSTNPKAVMNTAETIVINDSDDDDDVTDVKHSVVQSKLPDIDVISLSSDESDDDENSEPMEYYVVKCLDGTIKTIPHQYIANATEPAPTHKLQMKTRVIARRQQGMLPCARIGDEYCQLYKCDERDFYAGIISNYSYFENDTWHHLVFFDDGHVQYIPVPKIRPVFAKYSHKHVHKNGREFYEYYFKSRLAEIVGQEGGYIRCFLNGEFELANIVESCQEKPGVFLLHFEKSSYGEWLYVGSPRLEPVWNAIIRNDKLKRFYHANTTMIEVSSDSEEDEEFLSPKKYKMPIEATDLSQEIVVCSPKDLIKNYKPGIKLDRRHICNRKCVEEYEEDAKIFEFDPLKRPLLAGWKRPTTGLCHYVTPCGRPFNSIDALHKYLLTTKSKLTIDCFTYSPYIDVLTEVRTASENMDYLNNLVSGGWRENRPIPVVSISKNKPDFDEYVTRYIRNPRSKKVPAILSEDHNPFLSSCNCDDDCSDKSNCSCWKLTQNNSNTSIGYNFKRLDNRIATGIYECNSNCKCSSRCLNRVVKAQVEQKLELYETKDRGYGIRCQTDLPKGTFVACYFGDLLHGKTADERAMKKVGSIYGDEYFMQLDHIEVAEQYKDGYESDVEIPEDLLEVPDELLETPLKRMKLDDSKKRFQRFKSKVVLPYFPDILKKREKTEDTQRTSLFGENAVEFVVDGRYRGNISRFFNHSCSPNLFSQTVFIDTHDLRFPWLAFFTAFDIRAGTELTWDYNYLVGSIVGREMECKCGAPKCRKRLL